MSPCPVDEDCRQEDDVSWCVTYLQEAGQDTCNTDSYVRDSCCYACRNPGDGDGGDGGGPGDGGDPGDGGEEGRPDVTPGVGAEGTGHISDMGERKVGVV